MTEQEFSEYMDVLGRGAEWCRTHPECFKSDSKLWIPIVEIPEEARIYVEFSNGQKEYQDTRRKMLDSLGLIPHANVEKKKLKWGTK